MSTLLAVKAQLRRAPLVYSITGAIWRCGVRNAWRIRSGLFRSVPIRCRSRETTVLLHPAGQIAEALWSHDFERTDREFVASTIRTGMAVLNVGANAGLYTLIASKIVGPSGSVHAFEPSSSTFALLEKNVRINSCCNVRLNHVAAWHSPGFIHLIDDASDPELDGHRRVDGFSENQARFDAGGEIVRCISLDEYAESANLKSVDYIIMDIEGAEFDAMQGARKLLQRFRPIIIFECTCSHQAIEELLGGLGYRCFAYRDGRIKLADMMVDSRAVNLIARTEESALRMNS